MKAFDIVAYTYEAEILCPACLIGRLVHEGKVPDVDDPAETVLDIHAAFEHVDRQDESTFDSDDFPKVVFASQVEDGESCGECEEAL
jgi:hypothetical protein